MYDAYDYYIGELQCIIYNKYYTGELAEADPGGSLGSGNLLQELSYSKVST